MEQFYWGAATSSHQIEGGNRNDWTEWERRNAHRLAQSAKRHPPKGGWPEFILQSHPSPLEPENYISGGAVDHYNRFREDFDLAKSLGHNAHRFSLEWSRIEPEEGRFNGSEIAHYRAVIAALRERGLEPFVTLWHWTVPCWFSRKGGFAKRRNLKYFERFAERVAAELPGVKFWLTLNEPEIYTLNGYGKGIWPPEKRNALAAFLTLRNLARAHRLAYRAIKEKNPAAQVGIAKNNVYFEAYRQEWWNAIVKRCMDWCWNFYFLNLIAGTQDFIGLNYYFHNRIRGKTNQNENRKTNDMGWELYPEGIYYVLLDLRRYRLPIYITENGLADARDANRAWFMQETLAQIRRAISEDADVRGYFHWSLLDNFEWDKGFWPRFGLVEIDYRTLERKPRPSAWRYKELIEKGIGTI